jgi:hypothetical protein
MGLSWGDWAALCAAVFGASGVMLWLWGTFGKQSLSFQRLDVKPRPKRTQAIKGSASGLFSPAFSFRALPSFCKRPRSQAGRVARHAAASM